MPARSRRPVALGLGANLGAAEASLLGAIERLDRLVGPLAVASLWRSAPVSPIPQPDYLNTAVVGVTDRSARHLLAEAKALEAAAGRRPRERWGPRELDVDLLVLGDEVVDEPDLVVPHPRLAERAFVLLPLAEVAPELPVPPDGRTVAELAAVVADAAERGELERIGWSRPPLAEP